ncbi:MAG: dethiobiotin synthase [Saprospiraceae bacterium]|nr:dethiobiotin synthase [Candidatus Brachybacter algidus]MBL0118041.1 dethiobiotin synthase [Candidatus Brachybacter algidus]
MKSNLNKEKILNALPSRIFVTGIGTGIGKTIVSGYLCGNFGYDYWKPIQSGDLENSDSIFITNNVTEVIIWPERYKLTKPMSPHAAAEIDEVEINLIDFELPKSNNLLVEGAGGLMVPLNDQDLMIDLIQYLRLPVVLVIRDYLGCINHTILSYEILKQRKIEICCVVFNGNFTPSTLSYFENIFSEVLQLHLPELIQ